MQDTRDDALDALWGAREIGAFIKKKPRAIFYMAEKGLLPIRKTGRQLHSTKAELTAALSGKYNGVAQSSERGSPPISNKNVSKVSRGNQMPRENGCPIGDSRSPAIWPT